MTTTKTNIDAWLAAIVASGEEIATTALGAADVVLEDPVPHFPTGMAGAFIALVGDVANIQVGLVASPMDCDLVARMLLMADFEDEISGDDTIDAVSELANILGGGVKSRMIDTDPSLRLGLPLFSWGDLQPSQGAETWSVGMEFSGVKAYLLVLRNA